MIENRGGAGGVIAAKAAGSAEPDGYTLFMGNTSVLVLVPILSRKAGYDPAKLFTPVARLAESYQVLVVHPSLPVKIGRGTRRLCEGQSRQAQLRVGRDRQHHPSRRRAVQSPPPAIKIVHVPYNSGAEATTAVLGGQVQMTFVNVTGLPPLIADGKLRALAVTSPKRQAAAARRADHDRERLSGFRGARVLRHRGAGRNARADRRQAQRHHQCRDDVERDADHAQAAGRRRPARARRRISRRSSPHERRRWSAVAKAANISID